MHTHTLDASSILHAWDNYPLNQFPNLWKWLGVQLNRRHMSIAAVALQEVEFVDRACSRWLKGHGAWALPIDMSVLQGAQLIKNLLNIVGDAYNAKGVNENDLLIIACAKQHGVQLITNEGLQFMAPQAPAKRKIPSVCDLPAVQVAHQNFLQYLVASQQVF